MKKALFIQPKKYFDELGFNYLGLDADFGLIFTTNLKERLSKYDMVFSCNDLDDSSRHISMVARTMGIKTIFVMDGVYEDANARKNPISLIKKKTILNPICYDNVLTPTIEHIIFLEEENVKGFLYHPKRIRFDINKTENETEKKCLITTAKTAYFDHDEFVLLLKSISEIVKELMSLEYKIEFRIFDEKLNERLKNEYNFYINVIDVDFSEVLSKYDLVVTPPSSIVLPIIKSGIKCITLNFRSNEVYLPGVIYDVLKKPGELSVMIDRARNVQKFRWVVSIPPYDSFTSKSVVYSYNSVYFDIDFVIRFFYKKFGFYRVKKYILSFYK